jgi:hypothetical protein
MLYAVCWATGVRHTEIGTGFQTLEGSYGVHSNTALIFGLLPMFGFFIGLLVALWRKERGI